MNNQKSNADDFSVNIVVPSDKGNLMGGGGGGLGDSKVHPMVG